MFRGMIEHEPAQKYDDSVALRRDETQHENVLGAAVVALRCGFAKR